MAHIMDKRIRSLFVGWAVIMFLVFSLLIPLGQAAPNESEAERTAKLVEGARKEGKLLWYESMTVMQGNTMLKKFQEKYPFIETALYRTTGESMMTRILAEERAKRYLFDAVQIGGLNGETLKRKGILAKYDSPERKFYGEGFKDPDGYWTSMYHNLDAIVYNTRLVPPKDVPRSWNDLLLPKWKGKMAMDGIAFYWFAIMLRSMGEKNGLEYMKKLSEQNIQFRIGKTLITNLVAASEASLGIAVYNQTAEEAKAKGAPVDWVSIEPVIPQLDPLGISAHAPHPNAAKLFVDFVLSREGQEIVASFLRIPTRADVDPLVPKLKKGLTILPFDTSITDDYERYVKLFREILVKK